MRRIVLVALSVFLVANGLAALAETNLCPNPSFEQLNPAGDNFPLNWSPQKGAAGTATVAIDKDAQHGAIAVRLIASATQSAGVNSNPIGVRKGEVRLHYKAIRAASPTPNLHFYAIGLSANGAEITRQGCDPEAKYIGDGKWHSSSLKFDFTRNPGVVTITLAPRINETGAPADGEMLIDNFGCFEDQVGARPEIEAFYQSELIPVINQPFSVGVQIVNTGDQPVPAAALTLTASAAVTITDPSKSLTIQTPSLLPNRSVRFSWPMICKEPGEYDLTVTFKGENFSVSRSRRVLSVAERNPRRECTRADGFWRLMPSPVPLQESTNTLEPLKVLRSAELPDSFIGVTAQLPRSRDLEVIFEPEHLIDGNAQTSWSARAHDVSTPGFPDSAEIAFATPQNLKEIQLVPYWKAEGFPLDFTVQVHTGGVWQTVYEGCQVFVDPATGLGDKQPFRIPLSQPVSADGVRLEVTRFTATAGFFTDCATTFSLRLSGIAAINDATENVALAAKGSTIKVSSTFRSYYNSAEVVKKTYPELFNLGVKWNRVGQWGDWTCWAAVEQRKGEYYFDPATDQAITESVQNGVSILYTLCYGNPLYEATPWLSDPGPVWRHGHPFTGDGGPTTPEAIQGFVNYASFIANHLKGRVQWYEIWNEENSWAWYGSPPSPQAFGALLRETAKALKAIDPEIKVVVGGTAALAPTFISQALDEGAGPFIDAIAFHPYTMPYPEMGLGSLDVIDGKQQGKPKEELGFQTYKEMVVFLKKTFERFNPKIELWADEWNAVPTREGSPYRGGSEIIEAKHATRFFTMNTLLGIHAVWWSLANENYLYDWGILRTGDLSKKPIYYAIQNVSTILSGARADSSIQTLVRGEAPSLFCETLRGRDGEVLVAVWSAESPADDYSPKRISLRIDGITPALVEAIDPIHGVVQQLVSKPEGTGIVLDGLLVTDYPIFVRAK